MPFLHSLPTRVVFARAALLRTVIAVLGATLLASCSTMGGWWQSTTTATREFLHISAPKRPGPLPAITATVRPQLLWRVNTGKAAPGLAPAITADAVYAASTEGMLARIDPQTGRIAWRINTGRRLAGGVGADDTVVIVGTDKGEVLAFDTSGRRLWQARVSSEVIAPPAASDGMVAVWSGDGRIYGLLATDGSTKWVHQRTNPALTLRAHAGGVVSRGGLFSGSAGGKLVALDIYTGTVGWESNVATPKGATELERIADVVSRPLVQERRACAVAYQGRLACFDVLRGTLEWSRDISSLAGIAGDDRQLYITDDRGNVHALDVATGASVWTQDKLARRWIGGPQLVGDAVGVVDGEGILHLLDPADGALVGRLATDGTPATGQPITAEGATYWQSEGGAVYAVTTR